MTSLSDPLIVGELRLPNRIVMAPLIPILHHTSMNDVRRQVSWGRHTG